MPPQHLSDWKVVKSKSRSLPPSPSNQILKTSKRGHVLGLVISLIYNYYIFFLLFSLLNLLYAKREQYWMRFQGTSNLTLWREFRTAAYHLVKLSWQQLQLLPLFLYMMFSCKPFGAYQQDNINKLITKRVKVYVLTIFKGPI